ncbi:hypothetical protein OF83DRAFT_1179886 [Amylostereum chailletii]|nr:hypothetical protein OF83DRAFT_1179886 [Amylostereum chailletii]
MFHTTPPPTPPNHTKVLEWRATSKWTNMIPSPNWLAEEATQTADEESEGGPVRIAGKGRAGYVYFGLGDTETQEGSDKDTVRDEEEVLALVPKDPKREEHEFWAPSERIVHGNAVRPAHLPLEGPSSCLSCYQWQAEAQWFRDRYHVRHDEVFELQQKANRLAIYEAEDRQELREHAERVNTHSETVRRLEDRVQALSQGLTRASRTLDVCAQFLGHEKWLLLMEKVKQEWKAEQEGTGICS